jgi:Yip1-like protein
MKATWRAKAMLLDPCTEWTAIERESGDPAYLLSRYVAVLALVPAVCGFIGASVIGAVVPGTGLVRASLFDGFFGAIFGYAMAVAIVLVLALIINLLAPLFGGRKDFDSAFKLAVYSYTPVWLAGIFLLLPGLRFLILLSFYGAYMLVLGLPRLMKSPAQKSYGYAVVIVVCACALTLIAAAMQRMVFHTAGV